jgi:hypothetical protein
MYRCNLNVFLGDFNTNTLHENTGNGLDKGKVRTEFVRETGFTGRMFDVFQLGMIKMSLKLVV